MSLYHEAADVLSAPSGGNLKTRIFTRKDLKSPHQQIYALALESCKWSQILKEVIDAAGLLRHERKLSPVLSLLLVHDLLLSKRGISLPATHGLRASVDRHKARLNSELARARLRRKAISIAALREQVEAQFLGRAAGYPRWVRINTIKTTLEDQLGGLFKDFKRVYTPGEVTAAPEKRLYIDEHVPDLVAVSPNFEITKTDAYSSGCAILQDKASCFPAYLLDPRSQDGDVIDTCAAPGNKTSHLAAIVQSRVADSEECMQKVYAFEKDTKRSRTLDKMIKVAGAKDITRISFGQDFLKVDPHAEMFRDVGCMLLDPSCSGSGIVGRETMPTLHLPEVPGQAAPKAGASQNRKRKREDTETSQQVIVDDDGKETILSSEKELKARLEALSSFQLTLLLRAFEFPSARKITYSTCSIHAEENEQVVIKSLQSEVAKRRGWRVLNREEQVRGLREWPVRGSAEASNGDKEIADACIRTYEDDGRGVMGFFVAGFVRDVQPQDPDDGGPYIRDEDGRIIRDTLGMPTLKPDLAKPPSNPIQHNTGIQLPGSDTEDSDAEDNDEDSDTSEEEGADSGGDEWAGFD